jgi:IclR family transcriptional regulator, pca regulon regulatory protein
LDRTLAEPTRSGLVPRWQPERPEIDEALQVVRERGWAITDEQLARGIRSVATAVRDGDGRTVAAVNVNSNSAETSIETLTEHHLPLLLTCAEAIGRDWVAWHSRPLLVVS